MDGSRVLQVPPELPLKDKAKLPNNNSGIPKSHKQIKEEENYNIHYPMRIRARATVRPNKEEDLLSKRCRK